MRHALSMAALFAVALVASAGPSYLRPPVALAACSGNEEVIFVQYKGDQAYATRNTFELRDRDLNDQCTAEAHSTAHLNNLAFTGDVEVGWFETWCGSPGG